MYEKLISLIAARPLQPFRVHLTAGGHIDIVAPNQAVPTRTEFVVGMRNRFRHIPLASISRIETLKGRHNGKKAPR